SFGDLATALADACLAADLATQVVEPPLPDVAVAEDVDLVDARRVDHEGPLDTDAMRHAPDREVLAEPSARDADHRAVEHLDALARAFDDLRVDPHCVPCTQRGDLLFLLLLFELVDHVHVFFNSLVCARLWAACCLRHCLMRAWSPDRSTSGTVMPRYSAGRVNCGQPVISSAKLSWARDPGSPTTPGTSLAVASMSTIAGISPPLRT